MWSTRWSHFPSFSAELNRLRDEMDRAFGGTELPRLQASAYPPMNVWDDEVNLYVEAEIPGLEIDDLEIFVNGDDQLTIQGECKMPEIEKGIWHRKEREYGKFSRLVRLPDNVDGDQVVAEYEDGVLLLTMPKKEEAKPRRIDVKVGS